MRLRVLTAYSLITIGACSRGAANATPRPQATGGAANDVAIVERARAIHKRVITIDTHRDIPDNFATPDADPKTMNSQVNLDKMKAGGYDMAFFAVASAKARMDSGKAVAKAKALNKFASIHRMAEQMYLNLSRSRLAARIAERTTSRAADRRIESRTMGDRRGSELTKTYDDPVRAR
jgi:hypothetical protein